MNPIHDIIYSNCVIRPDRAEAFEVACETWGFPQSRRWQCEYWERYGDDLNKIMKEASDFAKPILERMGQVERRPLADIPGFYTSVWQLSEIMGHIHKTTPEGKYTIFFHDDCHPASRYEQWWHLVNNMPKFDIMWMFKHDTFYKGYEMSDESVGLEDYPEVKHGFGNTEQAMILSSRGAWLIKQWQFEYPHAMTHAFLRQMHKRQCPVGEICEHCDLYSIGTEDKLGHLNGGLYHIDDGWVVDKDDGGNQGWPK